jgi:formylglycine-generating enzyme required for sulfatase activity
MKKGIIIFILPAVFALLIFIGATPVKTQFTTKYFNKMFVPVLGADIQLYACKYEASNGEYKEFINDLKNTGRLPEADQYNFDTSLFNKKYPWFNDFSFMKNYYLHPAYNVYPVISIPYEGALKYCEWLTEKYNAMPQKKFKKVIFRLPTEQEWMKAVDVYPGGRFPWYGELSYDVNRKCYANLKFRVHDSEAISEYLNDGCWFPGPPDWYKPNRLGIYNIIGNVSEMTSKKGVAKGGSWDTFVDEAGVDNKQSYEGADPTIGFRVFMEIVEK